MVCISKDILVKKLEDRLKSFAQRRKARMVMSEDEEAMDLEDPSKQGRMDETEFADTKEEFAGTTKDVFHTVEETDEEIAKRIQEEDQARAVKQQEQERMNLQAAQEIQRQFDQEKQTSDDIDWDTIVKQFQERQSGSMISFKKLRAAQVPSVELIQEQPTEAPIDLTEEELKKFLEIVLSEEFRVEVLQTKHPIMDWEIHTDDSRKYWKIIRVVKDKFTLAELAKDMEKALWVELKRLYEPDEDDTLCMIP
ncbi:hypothetical protein Tco_1239756 [Tanacetum coccineum]